MKNKDSQRTAILFVNLAVFLFGTAGLFAKWIQLPALCITFWRVLFSSVTLAVCMLFQKIPFAIKNQRDAVTLFCGGAILSLHWWSFLASIQISTVAIGTITFSSFPLFVTFLEPLVFHERLTVKNIVLALLILSGVGITVPEFSLENRMFAGILVGMVSALSYAVLTILNKAVSMRYSGVEIAFYEQASASLVLLPFAALYRVLPSRTDFFLLLLLGVWMTALAHTLFITSLKQIPARLASICSSLETVYGILLAFLILGEVPALREVLGAVVIVGTVLFAQTRADGAR